MQRTWQTLGWMLSLQQDLMLLMSYKKLVSYFIGLWRGLLMGNRVKTKKIMRETSGGKPAHWTFMPPPPPKPFFSPNLPLQSPLTGYYFVNCALSSNGGRGHNKSNQSWGSQVTCSNFSSTYFVTKQHIRFLILTWELKILILRSQSEQD